MKARTLTTVPMSEINVTPLVDVMLVLLMVFMLSAPILTHRVKLPLNGGPPGPIKIEPTRLKILADGTLSLNDRYLERVALEAQLRFEVARNSKAALQVEAQMNARYGDIAQVLATARNAGFNEIGFKDPPAQ